jgi:hypothetical protein
LGFIGDLAVQEGDVLFVDPFRLGFMDYLRDSREMIPKNIVLRAGLPAPDNRLPKYTREALLIAMLEKLKLQIRSPLRDKDWEKVAWVYNRLAAQLGQPPASSYPRARPKE